MNLPIYMDNHATTRIDPRVLDAMMPYLTDIYGNPSSRNHEFGWEAEKAVEDSRKKVAELVGCTAKELIFTSGATESDNLAIQGVARQYREKGNHIITCATEHHAVLDTCKSLEAEGFEITYLPVDRYGLLDPEDVRKAVHERTILISVMYANNEIGTIQPIAEIGAIAKEREVIFHSDAVQAVGKIPVNVQDLNVDLVSLSGHKTYGPKGVGALYVRKKNPRVHLTPIIHGGGHEKGLRSGTLNVHDIVGMAKAYDLAMEEMKFESPRLKNLRDRLYEGIRDGLDDVHLHGHPEKRLPNNLNVSFDHVDGESLIMTMKDIAISSGSACSSNSLEPSHVHKAIGVSDELAQNSVRFGLGRFNTAEEVEYTITKTVEAVRKLRSMSPLYETTRRKMGFRAADTSS